MRPSPGGRERNRVGPCYTRSRLASGLSFTGLAQPRALGLLCPRRQSNQNAAGDTPDPVLPNRMPAKEHCAATETPRFGWSLVIGLVGYRLRLSALVLIGTSCRAK